jgi:nucleotide-binding universal stress UspA family protein
MVSTILVPIDFSTVSLNALDYAKNISRILNSKIILFHSIHLQMISNEMVDMVYSEVIKDGLEVKKKMEELLTTIRKDGIACEIKIVSGFLADDIKKAVAEYHIDMVVTGTSGAKGIEGLFFGTNSATMFENVHCPVLIIPKDILFRAPKKIMYATDFNKKDFFHLKEICAFAHAFQSEVMVTHINSDTAVFDEEEARLDRIADMTASEISFNNISYKLIHSEDICEGLDKMVASENIQLLCMSRSDKSFFQKVFSKSNTKEMAYRTRIPLLLIHFN